MYIRLVLFPIVRRNFLYHVKYSAKITYIGISQYDLLALSEFMHPH